MMHVNRHFSSPRLTHWDRVTHIYVSELTIIGSDNGLSPGRRQAIIWNNAGLLLIEPLGTNFSEIAIGIQAFSFKKMHLNMSSVKWRPFCLGLNVLRAQPTRRTGHRLSVRTTTRHLLAAGYHSHRPARCPGLTLVHRLGRRQWTRRHLVWDISRWCVSSLSSLTSQDSSRITQVHELGCVGSRVRDTLMSVCRKQIRW